MILLFYAHKKVYQYLSQALKYFSNIKIWYNVTQMSTTYQYSLLQKRICNQSISLEWMLYRGSLVKHYIKHFIAYSKHFTWRSQVFIVVQHQESYICCLQGNTNKLREIVNPKALQVRFIYAIYTQGSLSIFKQPKSSFDFLQNQLRI